MSNRDVRKRTFALVQFKYKRTRRTYLIVTVTAKVRFLGINSSVQADSSRRASAHARARTLVLCVLRRRRKTSADLDHRER